MVDVQPELERDLNLTKRIRIGAREAVMDGDLWVGILADSGRSREPKEYAAFEVELGSDNTPCHVVKKKVYSRSDSQYKLVCKHFYGRRTMQPFECGVVDGRTCILLLW